MKTMKKALAILLSVLMVMSITVTAVATTTVKNNTIIINETTDGYTYEAYQIFKGDIGTGEHDSELFNLQWGDGINSTQLLRKLVEYNTLDNVPGTADPVVANVLKGCFTDITEGSTAWEVAAKLAEFGDDTERTIAFAKLLAEYTTNPTATDDALEGGYKLVVPDGYYLIKNTAVPENSNKAFSSFMLKVVGGDITVNPKAEEPTLDKKIWNDDKEGTDKWDVYDDSQIGDDVEFRIVTTVPDTRGYSEYTYKIHDKLSAGLEFDASSVELYYGEKGKGGAKITGEYYKVLTRKTDLTPHDPEDPDNTRCTFVIEVEILKLIGDNKIENKTSSIYTYYKAKLTDKAKVYPVKENNTAHLEYSNDPMNEEGKAETPKKTVYEWTFKFDFDKVDATKKTKVPGAKFVLSKNKNLQKADGTFEANLVGTIADGVPATKDELIQFVKNGKTYTVYDGKTALETGETLTYVIETDETGNVGIQGLEVGTYYLYETKAPDGYNALKKPVKVAVEANYTNAGADATQTIKFNDTEAENGHFEVDNKKGSKLPETGGIGTTIFYVVGGAMMFVAVVLLVTKKKMSKNNK